MSLAEFLHCAIESPATKIAVPEYIALRRGKDEVVD
jgi:hypothetical protein